MYVINNKFEIGEECYTAYRNPVSYTCPVCEGKGEFGHNGHIVKCNKCWCGKVYPEGQKVMDVCKVKVRKINVSITENQQMSIYYELNNPENNKPHTNAKIRDDNTLFKTKEKAEEYMKEELKELEKILKKTNL